MAKQAAAWEIFLEMTAKKQPIGYKHVPFPHPPNPAGAS